MWSSFIRERTNLVIILDTTHFPIPSELTLINFILIIHIIIMCLGSSNI